MTAPNVPAVGKPDLGLIDDVAHLLTEGALTGRSASVYVGPAEALVIAAQLRRPDEAAVLRAEVAALEGEISDREARRAECEQAMRRRERLARSSEVRARWLGVCAFVLFALNIIMAGHL